MKYDIRSMLRTLFCAGSIAALLLLSSASSAFAESPYLDVSAGSGASGSSVTISGFGFKTGEAVSVWFGGTRTTTFSSGATYADQNGSFTLPITVPWNSSGSTIITAQGNSSGIVATTAFNVNPSSTSSSGTLSISPHDGAPGTQAVISGSAFTSGAAVTMYFGSTVIGSATTDTQGHLLSTITVPSLPEGLVIVTATGANPFNPPKFYIDAGGTTTIPPPPVTPPVSASLSLSPSSGTPGTSVLLRGQGFADDEGITFGLAGSYLTARADNLGNFNATFSAPSIESSQNVAIVAIGQQSGRSASASFYDEYVPSTPPPPSAPDNATLQAEIVALQQEIAHLTALINSLFSR